MFDTETALEMSPFRQFMPHFRRHSQLGKGVVAQSLPDDAAPFRFSANGNSGSLPLPQLRRGLKPGNGRLVVIAIQ